MKRIAILSILLLRAISYLWAQDIKTKPDTMSIILNGEHITLPVPKEGNKTTINLEDSSSIIQISVGKISKFKTPAPALTKTPEKSISGKRISWLNELDFGVITLSNRMRENYSDTAYGFNFSFNSGPDPTNNRATSLKLTPKTVYPGFSVGFSIREKSRPIGHSKFNFITGSRFRYGRFANKGEYEIKEIKTETKNGVTTYFPDSVYSVKTGVYRSVCNSFSFLFPFLISTNLSDSKDNDFKIAAGINLVLNINSSKISENIKSAYTVLSYVNPQIIQFQPIIKASRNKTSVYLSYSLSRTRIGYGATQSINGNTLYFGMAYKLY